jgi:hypothetical protein
VKRFKIRERWETELAAYRKVPWACPKLYDASDLSITIETLPRPTQPDPEGLWRLLEAIHQAGVNHRDVHSANLVVHRTRGLLLIDWEWACFNVRTLSYDLAGPASGVVQPEGQGGQPMWWGADHKKALGRRWARRRL